MPLPDATLALTPVPIDEAAPPLPISIQPGWPAPFTYGNPNPPPTEIPGPLPTLLQDPEVITVLLIGSDRRASGGFRTDVLIVAAIHPGARAAAMLSIPRDLYVYLPGYSMQRINTAYLLGETYQYPGGGQAMLADTIRYNLGIQIDHYARVEMAGFEDIIDTLGGVDVRIVCSYTDWRLKDPDLNPNEEDNWALFTAPTGVVHMDGDYALWYARSRQRSSDFDRSRRQQEVLRSILRQATQLDLITRLPALYEDLRQTVYTDLQLQEMIELAPLAARIDPSQVSSAFIGRDQVTSWRVPTSGAQVLLPRPDAIQELLEKTFSFQTTDSLVPTSYTAVEVANASGQDDLAALAAERLTYAGFAAFVSRANVESGTPTHVIDYGLSSADEQTALMETLGLAPARLVELPDPSAPFAFRLVVGDDYKPCFNPTRNQ